MMRSLACALLAASAAIAAGQDAAPSVVVVLDNSGSMMERMPGGDTRMEVAKRALVTVLERAPADAWVGILQLNPPRIGDDWLVPLGPVHLAATRPAVSAVVADGPTPLGNATKLAADALLAARKERRYGDFKVLLVTDGEATDPYVLRAYLPEAQARGLSIDVIGVAMASDHSLAQSANSYRNAADADSLERAISAAVLGESVNAVNDAGETDFEAIAFLPAEVATAALRALDQRSDGPLVARPTRGAIDPNPFPPTRHNPGPPQEPGAWLSPEWIFPVLAVAIFILRVRAMIAKASRRN